MKIDIHSSYINNLISSPFYKSASEQLPLLVKKRYPNKIRKLQFYSCFFSKDGNYPFADSKKIYFPLTIVLSDKTWETVWISWEHSPKEEYYGGNRSANAQSNVFL